MREESRKTGRACWDDPDYPMVSWGPRGPMIGMRRGDFRFLVMTALAEKPMHGYGLIQELGKTYQRQVSAGLVYPTLQELEDRGYLTSAEGDGKRVYSITDEGRSCLERNKGLVERLKAGREYADRMGRFGFLQDLKDMQALVMMNDVYLNEDKLKRMSEILGDTKKKLAAVVFEEEVVRA
jgi:DNA-binding PadR family transcriptional regulator